jgi:outer membrane protein OmpA-like peptidoglycan-associated protein
MAPQHAWRHDTDAPKDRAPSNVGPTDGAAASLGLASSLGNRAFTAGIAGEFNGVDAGGVVHTDVARAIAGNQGSGRALDASVRQRVAPLVGDPLTDVSVHADDTADMLARAVSARAFTTGTDVYFAAGEYRPGTNDGDALLVHELAHVAQQRGASTVGPLTVSEPGDPMEVAAEEIARNLDKPPAASEPGVARTPLRAARTHIQRAKAIPAPALDKDGGVVWFAPWAWMTGHEQAVDMSETAQEMEPESGTTHGIIAMGLSSAYWTPRGGGPAGTGGASVPFAIGEDGKLSVSPPGAAFGLTIPNYEASIDQPVVTAAQVKQGEATYDTVSMKFGFKWHRSEQVSDQTTKGTATEKGKTTGHSETVGGETKVEASSEEKAGGDVGVAKGEVTEKQGGSVTVSGSKTDSTEDSKKTTDSSQTQKTTTGPGPQAGDGVYSWVLTIRSVLQRPVKLTEDFTFPFDKADLAPDQIARLRAIATGVLPDLPQREQIEFRQKLKAGKYKITLRGFASSQGRTDKADYNQNLSKRRCDAVARALSQGTGIKPIIEDVIPIGDIAAAQDKKSGDTDKYQKVELTIMGEKSS